MVPRQVVSAISGVTTTNDFVFTKFTNGIVWIQLRLGEVFPNNQTLCSTRTVCPKAKVTCYYKICSEKNDCSIEKLTQKMKKKNYKSCRIEW